MSDQVNNSAGSLPAGGGREFDLFLDPSSTRTGYAIMKRPAVILEAGHLKPRRRDDSAEDRITTMAIDLEELIRKRPPSSIVIEIPSGKVHGRLRGNAPHLVVYGMAVGAMYWAARSAVDSIPGGIHLVNANEWTRGQSKAKRCRLIAAEFPAYAKDFASDSGGDMADAIGLGVWWYAKERRERLP